MEDVAARLRHSVDHSAGRPPELGVELIGDDLELLDRFDRGPRLHPGALPDDVVVVVAPVDRVVVVSRVLAVDADRIAAERLGADRGDDAWKQPDEADEIAVHARELHERLARDVPADLFRRHVNERGLALHGHRLADGANLQRDLNRRRLADFEDQIAAVELLESLQFCDDLVLAGHDAGRDERAVRPADGLPVHPGFLVPNGHGDTREQRSLRIDHPASDFGCSLLS